jgi:DNA-binding transcriptional ArsR family regulator
LKVRDVFVGMADPTRRQILELLASKGSLSAGALADSVAEISRPAVSRHLRILRECGLVAVERTGKEQRYVIDEMPIIEVRDRWMAQFAGKQVKSLKRLRRRVELGN